MRKAEHAYRILSMAVNEVPFVCRTIGDGHDLRGGFHAMTALRDTAWGTREFAFYDLNGNGLLFYRNLWRPAVARLRGMIGATIARARPLLSRTRQTLRRRVPWRAHHLPAIVR